VLCPRISSACPHRRRPGRHGGLELHDGDQQISPSPSTTRMRWAVSLIFGHQLHARGRISFSSSSSGRSARSISAAVDAGSAAAIPRPRAPLRANRCWRSGSQWCRTVALPAYCCAPWRCAVAKSTCQVPPRATLLGSSCPEGPSAATYPVSLPRKSLRRDDGRLFALWRPHSRFEAFVCGYDLPAMPWAYMGPRRWPVSSSSLPALAVRHRKYLGKTFESLGHYSRKLLLTSHPCARNGL